MTSKERIFACWNGTPPDYVPLTTQSFGFKPKPSLTWKKRGKTVTHWYSQRMEHIHLLPEPWDIDDDFMRVLAWRSLGVDDILDVSIPWSMNSTVTWEDSLVPPASESGYPVMVREYDTPSGPLRHAVSRTGEDPGEGWVIQPDHVPLIEDYNIPRAVEHAVSSPDDVPKLRYLYCPPDQEAAAWFDERMERVAAFSGEHDVPVQAWSAFGMDGVIWFAGVSGAIMMAMDNPTAFGMLVQIVSETDYARTKLACEHPGINMIVQRGWYSSTDFWSPKLFDEFMFPSIQRIAELSHSHGKKFGYVMTTGVETLGPRLADAGVDVLYFVDPVQDTITLEKARDLLGGRMTLVGGANSVTLATGDEEKVRSEVHKALEVLGPTNRFILQPVDAVFPDTPWESVEVMIAAWKQYR